MISRTGTAARDGRVIGVIGLAHCGSHFFQLILPPLFPLLKGAFGVGYTELGLVMTVFFACSGLAQTPAGFLVDRVGAARVLTGGLALLGTGALLAASARGYLALLPAAALMGLGNSVFHPSDYSILTHHVAKVRLGRAYAIHTVGGSLGWALAPVTMLAVASFAGWRVAVLTAGLMGFLITALVFASREFIETPGHLERRAMASPAQPGLLLSPTILLCFAFFALLAVAFVILQGFLPLGLHEAQGVPLEAATMAVTAYMLGMALGTLGGGVAADRWKQHQGIIAGGLLGSAVLVLLVGMASLPTALILGAMAVAGGCAGFATPSRDMLIRASTPPGAAGKVFGFVYSGLDLGATIGPVIAGFLLDAGSPQHVFHLIVGATALAVLTAIAVRPRPATDGLAPAR